VIDSEHGEAIQMFLNSLHYIEAAAKFSNHTAAAVTAAMHPKHL
jgi:hypothetical protein